MARPRTIGVVFPVLAALLTLNAAPAAAQNVKISQVWGGGALANPSLLNDFVELRNCGATPQSLDGWSFQSSSATSANWAKLNLPAVTINPGEYFLIQAGGIRGNPRGLPTPDAFSGGALLEIGGKVALVSNTTVLTGATPSTIGVVDRVGWGATATWFEGSGPLPSMPPQRAATRRGNGCYDTNRNVLDFSFDPPVPRRSGPQVDLDPTITVTQQPVGADVCVNTTVELSIVASSAVGAISYQWERNRVDILGETNPTLLVSIGELLVESALYRPRMTVGSTVRYGNEVVVSVRPSILWNQSGKTVNDGDRFDLTVTPTPGQVLTFQWRRNGISLAGEIAPTLTRTYASTVDSGLYDVVITNDCGSGFTPQVSVTVTCGTQRWLPGYANHGVDRDVYHTVLWDADGSGPQPARLVIGGGFAQAGNIITSGIALWDGRRWTALGSATGRVRSLCVWNNELYASFQDTSGTLNLVSGVAKWNGETWIPLLQGANRVPALSLAVHGGQLYAVSTNITNLSGQTSSGVVRWTGSTWVFVGFSPTTDILDFPALASYAGNLYVSARISSGMRGVYRWTDPTWQLISESTPNQIPQMFTYNGELVVGGLGSNINAWNGVSWRTLGTTEFPEFRAMCTLGADLVVASGVNDGNATPRRLLKWNGSSWQNFGPPLFKVPATMIEFGGRLHVGGSHNALPGSPFDGFGVLDGGSWKALQVGDDQTPPETQTTGFNGPLNAAVVYNGELVVGGRSDFINGSRIAGVARWDGYSWKSLGSGLRTINGSNYIISEVKNLVVFDGQLYAQGSFNNAGGQVSWGFARWNGTVWTSIDPGLSTQVSALVVYNGELYAGYGIPFSGGTATGLAKWNGSTWTSVVGLENRQPDGRINSCLVYSMVVWQGQLIVAGSFLQVNGIPADTLARFDGTTMRPFYRASLPIDYSTGVKMHIVGVYNNDLIVAGGFSRFDGVQTSNIVRWDGTAFQPMGNGLPVRAIRSLKNFGNELFAGGLTQFNNALSAWNGTSWRGVGVMENADIGRDFGEVRTQCEINGDLFVGGDFRSINGQPSRYAGRLTATGVPGVRITPGALSLRAESGPVSLRAEATDGYPSATFQWFKNGVPIDGETTPSFEIPEPLLADAGEYSVTASTACGSANSSVVMVKIACSLADLGTRFNDPEFTPDGQISQADYDTFIRAFIDGNVAIADIATDSLDRKYNPNGSVGAEDLDAFIGAYIGGCSWGKNIGS